MRGSRRDWVPLSLFAGTGILCLIFVLQYGVFGSRVDWVSQHSVLPDYFRQHFYQTGELFPDMAWNLGGGQNIYNFAYYGLYHPVYLLAYLLPFVEMDSYIMGSSMLCYGLSVVLFYRWLSTMELSREVRILTSCMFALAAPLLYHSYNQLMFVNYMPFLMMALLGVRSCIGREKGRRERRGNILLVLGLAGMIFSSFYFSIGGLAAAGLYAVSLHLERRRCSFFRDAARFCVPAGLAVLLAGVLLAPVAVILLSGGKRGR